MRRFFFSLAKIATIVHGYGTRKRKKRLPVDLLPWLSTIEPDPIVRYYGPREGGGIVQLSLKGTCDKCLYSFARTLAT